MNNVIMALLAVLALSLPGEYSYALVGTVQGGHPADCAERSYPDAFHRDEYVPDGAATFQEGQEYWGPTLLHLYTEQYCPGTTGIEIAVAQSTETVDAGSWEGTVSWTSGLTLPQGISLGSQGEVKLAGEESVTVEITSQFGCPPNLTPNIFHRVVLGPAYKDRAYSQPMKHNCWQCKSYVGPHYDWNCIGENIYQTCNNAYTESGTLTYLSSNLKSYVKCGVLLSQKSSHPCPISGCQQ